jgi:hypothetical protein
MIVIATARNAAGSHPEDLQVMINITQVRKTGRHCERSDAIQKSARF